MIKPVNGKLNRFPKRIKNIELRLNVTEKRGCGLRRGRYWCSLWQKETGRGVNKAWLMDEEAVLVCSPRIVPPEKITCGEWLAEQKIIHDDTLHPGANFPSWEEVLAATQAPYALYTGLHINFTKGYYGGRLAAVEW